MTAGIQFGTHLVSVRGVLKTSNGMRPRYQKAHSMRRMANTRQKDRATRACDADSPCGPTPSHRWASQGRHEALPKILSAAALARAARADGTEESKEESPPPGCIRGGRDKKLGGFMSDEILPQVFDNPEFGQLRVIQDESGEPWFVASDVAKALGYRDAANMARRLDDDEKGTRSVSTPGGVQQMTVVSEPGLYSAVLGSKVEGARRYKRWVTHDVLPSIRRNGGYMVTRADETPEQLLARALKLADATLRERDARIAELEPKALFADAVAASDGTCLVGELAKMMRQNGLDIGQNRMFELLRNDGYLGKSGSNRNVPTQVAMDLGLFRIKETAITHSDGHVTINRTPKVTGKGQRYFVDRYCIKRRLPDAG